MLTHRTITTVADWQAALNALPRTHLLQSWEWGEFKSRHGWTAQRLVWERDGAPVAAAQVLQRTEQRFGIGASLLYVPRGPLLDWCDAGLREQVLGDLQTTARDAGAMFLKIDPELPVGYGIPSSGEACDDPTGLAVADWLATHSWHESADQIQFRNTVLLDLSPSEEELLTSFKQKTRYNIRLAARRGVTVRPGAPDDLALLYRLYAETSARDGFGIRSANYYYDAWGSFMQVGLAQPFIAQVEDEVVGAVIIFICGDRATYMYGMSKDAHREKMPNHLLQWEAIRWAHAQGCTAYDFWGAPDAFDESDKMWGVWRFKAGFRGTVLRTIGAWDYPVNPMRYWMYNVVMPRFLAVMRQRGRRVHG